MKNQKKTAMRRNQKKTGTKKMYPFYCEPVLFRQFDEWAAQQEKSIAFALVGLMEMAIQGKIERAGHETQLQRL